MDTNLNVTGRQTFEEDRKGASKTEILFSQTSSGFGGEASLGPRSLLYIWIIRYSILRPESVGVIGGLSHICTAAQRSRASTTSIAPFVKS